MTVTFYHYAFHEDIWDQSPLGYDWFPMSPSDFVLPSVPPKDKNLILDLPIVSNHSPSIDMEISSIEPPPPRSPDRHRHQISSWRPSPPDPDTKARAAAVSLSRSQLPESEKDPSGSLEVFEEIPIAEVARLPKPEISLKLSLNDYISKMSLGSRPQWVKKLRPIKRGVDLPFPVASGKTTRRYPIRVNRPGTGGHRIDVPIFPTSFTEVKLSQLLTGQESNQGSSQL